jgi:hypothetical protein
VALRRGTPLTFRPSTLSDAVDGSNSPPGAMASLANLVPDPTTRNVFVPRPASVIEVDLSYLAGAGFVSSELVVGDLVYGTVATSRTPGSDEPYCYNLGSGSAVTVSGVTATNVPVSPPTSGDWTPPILAQVGGRIIVTHPGFPGGGTKFGWFDVSGFSETTTGNTNGSTTITGAPSILGVQPGMTISGTNITAGTTVTATANVVLTETGTTHTSTLIDALPVSADRAVGQVVAGPGIPAGATITVLTSPTSVTISAAATASATVTVTFTGATITLSGGATGSTNGVTLTIAGGSVTAPLWGAGDTDRNNLPSVPVGVAQFNGRAYFACGKDGIPFSDSGFACRISNNPDVQALTTDDGLAVTAIGALQLSSLLGGIVQSLIVFEGVTKMQQITGDMATTDLAMNQLPAATGTLSPLSLCSTNKGLAFVSNHGLRIVDFGANVSDAIGNAGDGVTAPFTNALFPSRICAAARGDTIRISAQADGTGGPSEFWYDFWRKVWTGPHTFPASLIQPWRDTYLMAPASVTASLWKSDDIPRSTSIYVENNVNLSWQWATSLLPDSGDMSMVALIEMTLACAFAPSPAPGSTATLQFISDYGTVLDTTTVVGEGTGVLWGGFNWGGANWGSNTTIFRQRSVDWTIPLVFKQGLVSITGQSFNNVRVGNLYMRYQRLGYKLEAAA